MSFFNIFKFLVNIGNHLVVQKVFDCDAMAWDSVIYKSKLLCGSINKHGTWTKNTSWVKKNCDIVIRVISEKQCYAAMKYIVVV